MQSTPTYYPAPPPAVFYIPTNAFPVTGTRNLYTLLLPDKFLVWQIIIGAFCLVFNAISIGVSTCGSFGNFGHGFWSGVLFIVTGAIGHLAIKQKTKGKIVSYMVLCIISATCSAVLLSLSILGALIPMYGGATEIAFETLMAIAGVIEGVLGIYGAAQCCKTGVCCCSQPGTTIILGNELSNNGVPYVYNVQGLQFPYPGISATPYGQQGQTFAVSPTFQPQFEPSGMVQGQAGQHSMAAALNHTPGDSAALRDEQMLQTNDFKQRSPYPAPYSVC